MLPDRELTVFHESDGDVAALDGKMVAIIGYGRALVCSPTGRGSDS